MKNFFKKIIGIKSKETNRGVAVLFAVLVSVLLISIAATMISISVRQTILSSTGRDSQYALVAANTALECALYWDLNSPDPVKKVFPISEISEEPLHDYTNVECNNGNIKTGVGFVSSFATENLDFNPMSNIFFAKIDIVPTIPGGDSSGPYCATFKVSKDYSIDEITGEERVTTTIESRGYNTCDLNSPRAIERGLELSYTNGV